MTLEKYKQEVAEELRAILSYWKQYTVDKENGGFYGSVNNDNVPDPNAPKGIVLNSRILWAFSAAYSYTKDNTDLQMADRAYVYIIDHFIDKQHGGVYWSVDMKGQKLEERKQIYGLAFCLYGLAAYYKITQKKEALYEAKKLFELIEKYSWDKKNGGYIEAFTREWKDLDDLRLSDKDDNERKTMNTHLHVIEAYATLYQVWPDPVLKEKISSILGIFNKYIINKETFHLNLFFDDDWNLKSTLQSYGHDIEGAWLLQECAEIIGDEEELYRRHAIKLAASVAKGIDNTDGGLWYERNSELVKEKHSWPQAEAMIGFFNAWQLTGDKIFLDQSMNSWKFIKQYICDKKKGEWFWGLYDDYSVMRKDKAGFWKCPYHNSRACLEIIKRIP